MSKYRVSHCEVHLPWAVERYSKEKLNGCTVESWLEEGRFPTRANARKFKATLEGGMIPKKPKREINRFGGYDERVHARMERTRLIQALTAAEDAIIQAQANVPVAE